MTICKCIRHSKPEGGGGLGWGRLAPLTSINPMAPELYPAPHSVSAQSNVQSFVRKTQPQTRAQGCLAGAGHPKHKQKPHKELHTPPLPSRSGRRTRMSPPRPVETGQLPHQTRKEFQNSTGGGGCGHWPPASMPVTHFTAAPSPQAHTLFLQLLPSDHTPLGRPWWSSTCPLRLPLRCMSHSTSMFRKVSLPNPLGTTFLPAERPSLPLRGEPDSVPPHALWSPLVSANCEIGTGSRKPPE